MLFRKMLRDIKANKAQFIAIFLMMFLGVFIFTGISSEWNGMQTHAQQLYKETNLADVIVYGDNFTSEDVSKLKKHENIIDVQRRASIDTTIANNKNKKIELYIVEDNTISKMKVMQGEKYTSSSDGIWIDQSYANENALHVNDTITLEMNGIKIQKEIKGIVLHPEYVYQNSEENMVPDHLNRGYAILSAKYFPYASVVPFSQLVIDTKTPSKMEQVVGDTLENNHFTFIQKKDMLSYSMLESEITQHQAFGQIFPIVFLLIAVLTTMTTVSKMVLNQRLQCGVLKALGFRNRTIMIHYFSHIIFITSIAAILGFISGPLIVPNIIYPMMKSMYILPEWSAVTLFDNIVVVIACVILCIVVAMLVGYKQLKDNPATMLRAGSVKQKQQKEKKTNASKMFNFYTQWNIRDCMRNKVRTVISIVGVAGCMGLLLCALGLQNSMDNMVNTMFEKLQTYEMKVQVNEQANSEQIKQMMNGTQVFETSIEMKKKDTKKVGSLSVQDETKHLKLQNTRNEIISLPKEGIALSYNLAKAFDVKEGDRISWRMMGREEWYQSKVSVIVHTPSAQGISMSTKVFTNYGMPFVATSIVGDKVLLDNQSGVQSIQYLQEDIAKSMDSMLEGMNVMIAILIVAAIVLGIVVIYNMGTFSYLEKTRDMATLKVLGFKNKQVKKLLRQQNFWLTIIGSLFGIPFGYALIDSVVSTMGEAMDMQIYISIISFVFCFTFTLLVSSLIMRVVSNKVKQIDMVTALKAVE